MTQVRALVVDDSSVDATVTRDQLIAQEYDVETVDDSREAYEMILDEENGTFDLIVLDVNLPGLDGVTLAKRLRQHEVMTPVLFLSSGVDPAVRLSITNMGPSVAYLEKGVDQAVLLATCTELLARNHLVLQLGRMDRNFTELKEIFLEKIPSPEDIASAVSIKLASHCPSTHDELLRERAASKEELKTLESESVQKRQDIHESLSERLEKATSVESLITCLREHPLSKVVVTLLGVILASSLSWLSYTYFLADGASRDVIQVKSEVRVLTTKMETNMIQQAAQMDRIEESVRQLLVSTSTAHPGHSPLSTALLRHRTTVGSPP